MATTEHTPHTAGTGTGELSQSTRQPSQLSVLLASAGTPPLIDPEQARLAPIRLHDTFIQAPERARLFRGDARSLFRDAADAIDPRHDALARVIRAVAAGLRQRLETYESATPSTGGALLRNVPALASARIEGALTGYDLRRGTAASFTAEHMLGSPAAEVDPLDDPEAGVLRRFIALATRGLMVERAGTRGGGVVADLGGVTLALAVLDMAANPRSTLRAARTRLSKGGKLGHDESARVRDVGQALREMLNHAVSGATTSGAAGRDLVKESTLSAEVMDHFAVGLARVVYDGLGPEPESPLVVPGAGAADALTVMPTLWPSGTDEPAPGPTLGLYNRVAFIPLPYARLVAVDSPGDAPAAPAARGVRAPALDEAGFARAREALRQTAGLVRLPGNVGTTLDTQVDTADPRHAWRRAAPGTVPALVARAAEQVPASTQVVILVGPRSALGRDVLDGFATALGQSRRWQILTPRATDRTLCFEPLAPDKDPGAALRRADVSRWLDADALRSIHWDLARESYVVINAAALDDTSDGTMDALTAILADVTDKADPRAQVLLLGAPTYATAAAALNALARHPELESGSAPLRGGALWLIRTDAPLQCRVTPGRPTEETTLAALAEPFAPGSLLVDHAARAALLPPEAKYRGRLLRLVALATQPTSFALERRVVERAAAEPWSGSAMRRTLQAGVASLPTARAAVCAGLEAELLGCMRHEVALLVAEWDGQRERPHALRLADVARGQLVESALAAHPRIAVLASDALAAALPAVLGDAIERAVVADALHGAALNLRAGGTVYVREDPRTTAPLGFTLRGGPADLYALTEVTVGQLPLRAFAAPQLELLWRIPAGRDPGIGVAATVLTALHDVSRRWGPEMPARFAPRDGRATFGVLLDVATDARLVPETLRCVLPLRPGLVEADAHRFAIDAVIRLGDVVGGDVATEWVAQFTGEGKAPSAIPLMGALLLREFVTRWTRALRVLPRYFPSGARTNHRYTDAPVFATGAQLGLATALLEEKGINPAGPNGRAVLARLPGVAADVLPLVREMADTVPIHPASQEGADWEVVERFLSIAWFLQVNFCASVPGAIQWFPPDGPGVQTIVQQHIDRGALKVWLQRKTARPDPVEQRVRSLIAALEPSIVIE